MNPKHPSRPATPPVTDPSQPATPPVTDPETFAKFAQLWQIIHRASAGNAELPDETIIVAWKNLTARHTPTQIFQALVDHNLAVKWSPAPADISGRIDFPSGRKAAAAEAWAAIEAAIVRGRSAATRYQVMNPYLAATCRSIGIPRLVNALTGSKQTTALRSEFLGIWQGHSENSRLVSARIFLTDPDTTARDSRRMVTIHDDNQHLTLVFTKGSWLDPQQLNPTYELLAETCTVGSPWVSCQISDLPPQTIPADVYELPGLEQLKTR